MLLVFSVLSLWWTSFCQRVLLGLKCTSMSRLEKILNFSDTPTIYGTTMLLHLFFLLSVVVLLCFVSLFVDFCEGPVSFWLLNSICFHFEFEGIFSALWFRVLIKLCPSGWWESKSKYGSICIGFPYISKVGVPNLLQLHSWQLVFFWCPSLWVWCSCPISW